MAYDEPEFKKLHDMLEEVGFKVGMERMMGWLSFNLMWILILAGLRDENLDKYLESFKNDYNVLIREYLPEECVSPPDTTVN